jgi:hypothetical protein
MINFIQDGGQPVIFSQNISRTKQDMKNQEHSFAYN